MLQDDSFLPKSASTVENLYNYPLGLVKRVAAFVPYRRTSRSHTKNEGTLHVQIARWRTRYPPDAL
jgi:hypothetical protein